MKRIVDTAFSFVLSSAFEVNEEPIMELKKGITVGAADVLRI